ncbi:MAG: FRG domain-containing protein [Clostridiales bacterium]|nr:FRG domain-containing protein [Clostridiales bacterium]
MSEQKTNEIEINGVVDYIDAIITLTNDEKQKFIFRGQPSTRYDVSSGAYRVISETKKDEKVNVEDIKRYHQLLLEQAHKINSDEERQLSSSPFELLAVLQHGGAKTGLIDFSYNPLVALFFACLTDEKNENDDGVVYYVKKSKFAIINNDCTIENIFAHNDAWYNYILDPVAFNTRILSQQGCFIIPNIGRIDEMLVDKYIVPNRCKAGILKTLANLGISKKELFKDFYGFCGWGASLIVESFYINDVIMRLQAATTYIFIDKLEKAEYEIEQAERLVPLIRRDHQVVVRWLYRLKGDLAVEKGEFEKAIDSYELSIEMNDKSRIIPSADNFGRCIDIIEVAEKLKKGDHRDEFLLKRKEYAKIILDFESQTENDKISTLLSAPEESKARDELVNDIYRLKFYQKAKFVIEIEGE